MLLQEHLRKIGLKLEKNVQNILGKPDIVFRKQRLVIFCDGDFWHGRDWPNLRQKLSKGTNADYWIAKISTNIKRDLKNNLELRKQGWKVVRFWESDIKKESSLIADKITKIIKKKNSTSTRK